jgi:hypothetical protein
VFKPFCGELGISPPVSDINPFPTYKSQKNSNRKRKTRTVAAAFMRPDTLPFVLMDTVIPAPEAFQSAVDSPMLC